MDGPDGVLAAPALAARFAGCGSAMFGIGVGENLTQIEIAADAFAVEAIEAEHRLGVGEVDRVFDSVVLTNAVGADVREIHPQGLQLRKLVRHAGRVLGTLAFLLTVIGPRAAFLLTHSISTLPAKLRWQPTRG